jgi:hypothetical protein
MKKSASQKDQAPVSDVPDVPLTRACEDDLVIHQDKRNYRQHDKKNLDLIGKSLTEFGAGRSIVTDNSGQIIGGNGTFQEAEKLGIKPRIVHTSGDELVVVVRDDIAPDDPRRAKLAVMDNSTSDSSEFKLGELKMDFTPLELSEMGINIPEDKEDQGNSYSSKIEGLYYQPTGEVCEIEDLCSQGKYHALLDGIEKAKISAKEKGFLKLAATRHIVFDYHKIAEFYAAASPEVQALMEQSALVVIDFEKAILNGFTMLAADIDAMREEDKE